jgi:hypothetical protein
MCIRVIFILGVFLITGCLNRYEKEVCGEYDVDKFELVDTNRVLNIFPKLSIKSSKEFILSHNDSLYTGQWRAYDNGDNTIIEFFFKDGSITEGLVGVDNIEVFSQTETFKCREFQKLSFRRSSARPK